MDKVTAMLKSFARAFLLMAFAIAGLTYSSAALAQPTLIAEPANGPLLFLESYSYTAILDSRYQQVGEIPVHGYEAVGSSGTFYIGVIDKNGYGTNQLEIFAPPYKALTARLTYGGFSTTGVAVDAYTGMFAVTGQWVANPFGGPGFIRFYRNGTTSQCNYVPFPAGGLYNGSAFDREGTFYSVVDFHNNLIASVSGGCKAKQVVLHRLSPNIRPAAFIGFDGNDNLVFADQATHVISTYAHPSSGPIGSPISTTTLQNVEGQVPYFSCLASDGKHLWASTRNKLTAEFNYPQGGAPIVVLHTPELGCAAVFPPLKP